MGFHYCFVNGGFEFCNNWRNEALEHVKGRPGYWLNKAKYREIKTAVEDWFFQFYSMLYGNSAPRDHLAALRSLFHKMGYLGDAITYDIDGDTVSCSWLFLYDCARYFMEPLEVYQQMKGAKFRNINVEETVRQLVSEEIYNNMPRKPVRPGDPAVVVDPSNFIS